MDYPVPIEEADRLYKLLVPTGVGDAELWGVTRPHCKRWLRFCFDYFHMVGIWSAGSKPYVEAMVETLFSGLPPPDVVFTADDTLFTRVDSDSLTRVPEKPILKLVKSHPMFQNMNLTNTLILDDNASNFNFNVDNGILIPAYNPELRPDILLQTDNRLRELEDWLMQPGVINALDVRTLRKDTIFSWKAFWASKTYTLALTLVG